MLGHCWAVSNFALEQAAKKLRDVYHEEDLKDRQCQNWYDKLRSGDFSLKDEKRSGRPNEVDDGQIKAIIKSDRQITVREIEEMLRIPKSTIERYLQRLGLVKKFDIWIPHELYEIHLTKPINACDLHLKRNKFDDDSPSVMNHHKQHQKVNCMKKRLCCLCLVVLERCGIF